MESVSSEQTAASADLQQTSEDITLTTTVRDSPAIRRLMDEVRYEDTSGPKAIG